MYAIALAAKMNRQIVITLSDPNIVNFFHDEIQNVINKNMDMIFCNEQEALNISKSNNIDEAITFINQKEKPLALYIFSNSNKNINKVLKRTSSGGICINHSTLHYSNYNLPFGGVNNSGFGRCHGIYGFKEFSNSKSIFRQYLPFSPTDLLVPPYNRYKKIIIKYLLKYF